MIAATLMVMMPWEAPRRSGYDACVAPEDAALEAALRRSSPPPSAMHHRKRSQMWLSPQLSLLQT